MKGIITVWFALLVLQLWSSGSGVNGFVFDIRCIDPRRCQHKVKNEICMSGTNEGGGSSDSGAKVVLLLPSFPPDGLQEESESIATRLGSTVDVCVVTCGDSMTATTTNTAESTTIYKCQQANLLLALGIESPMDVRFVATLFRQRRTLDYLELTSTIVNIDAATAQFALGGKPFAPLVGQWDEANPTWQKDIPWSAAAQDRRLMLDMQGLFVKGETGDFVQAIELFLAKKNN